MDPNLKSLHEIKLWDKRGTCIGLMLYMYPTQVIDYTRELVRVWENEWGGNAEKITVNGQGFTMPPTDPDKSAAHGNT